MTKEQAARIEAQRQALIEKNAQSRNERKDAAYRTTQGRRKKAIQTDVEQRQIKAFTRIIF